MRFEDVWGIRGKTPHVPDVIVPLGYGTLSNRLTDATRLLFIEALRIADVTPGVPIAFASSAHCFAGSEVFESDEKRELALSHRVQLVDAGGITNTVTEAQQIRKALRSRGISPKEVLVITGKMHGRAAQYVWEQTFPNVRISMRCIDVPEYQPDHTLFLQRARGRWIAANMLRQIALRLLPLSWVATIKHTQ